MGNCAGKPGPTVRTLLPRNSPKHVGPTRKMLVNNGPRNLAGHMRNDACVVMPFSRRNINQLDNRVMWATITASLSHLARALNGADSVDSIGKEIEQAVLKYCPQYAANPTYNFDNLLLLFKSLYGVNKGGKLREDLKFLLRKMIDSALNLPNLITQPIPVLKKGMRHSLSFNTQQCASLLANCFFCTFPRQSKHHDLSDVNFIRLFTNQQSPKDQRKIEKLKCILNYFRRVFTESRQIDSIQTFSRKQAKIDIKELLRKSQKPIRYPIMESTEKIEECRYSSQVDFANKYLGGGVLGSGCVQEEIRFAICPEMIVAMIFAESLDDNEAFFFNGCQRFSSYTGYADTFKFAGDFSDRTRRDKHGQIAVQVLAIDALFYTNKNKMSQFVAICINRELLKCYAGFSNCQPSIATGNWGCGAFNGVIELKYLIQLITASQSDKTLIYSSFGSPKTLEKLNNMNKMLAKRFKNVSQLYAFLLDLSNGVLRKDLHLDFDNLDYTALIELLNIK